MITIEKTEINASALLSIVATLKDINSEKIISVSEDGQKVMIRDRRDDEYEDFRIDLKFLDDIFSEIVNGIRRTLEFNDESEKYLKNCSFACSYYRQPDHSDRKFDHFQIFHDIHFEETLDAENDIKIYFCRLFRIDDEIFNNFNDCSANESELELPSDGGFNHYFKKLIIEKKEKLSFRFLSEKIEYSKISDILYSIKDLLINKGYDVSQIPNVKFFVIRQDQTLTYNFNLGKTEMEIKIEMGDQKVMVSFEKKC
ncbi:hypothetical protein [Chryseobacterium arthrosphaerae]|uniref:hypothetical protein n=1 Tax=Chryseobacterium arthrosphaerae TaxID=651561 RepID=UPI001E4FB0E9|nr:hypothetical protein [Chryseobacterium arthrosphaerae]UEQ76638.1 hypothetical protein J8N07_24040 [Chryseobacterium arthrosphaerae]